jgi:oligopeptide transport system substrate-binding protein
MFKKVLFLGLLMLISVSAIACADDETPDPSVVPTDPTVVPTDPTVVPTDPTVIPTDPTVVPTDPTVVPTDPTVETVSVSFNTKTATAVDPVAVPIGSELTASMLPTVTRTGYTFEGWFYGRPGLTWLEPSAIVFPITVDEALTLHAYWEPVNSRNVNYSPGETYTWSLTSDTALLLNPLEYEWSHENAIIDLMATPLYSTEVDWQKAINQGVADFPGDFSKIEAQQYSVEALDFVNILVGATQFPVDSTGNEHLTPEGRYDRTAATTFTDTEWTYHIREDLVFENGVAIDAYTFEYTLKQFLDPLQNNYRGNIYYKTTENSQGYPILNAYEYYTGVADWEDVGFEIIDDYTFKIKTFEVISQATAVGFGGMRLVEPGAYEASLTTDRTNSTYGTPITPYVSYGSYVLKSWDENQRLVFNKNFDYVLKGTINYKSQIIEIVDNVDQRMQLFANGQLSTAGLTQDYYAQYAENPNVYKAWDGYPQYIMVNTAASKLAENPHEHPTIMFDKRFRQALFYGFDRIYYANNVYAPNTAALLHVPLDNKSYIQDALYYTESPNYFAVLEKFNIDPATMGYIPARAVSLFTAAYDNWISEGNTGPVTLLFASADDEFSLNLANYVKSHYEDLFGSDKLIINVVAEPGGTGGANRARLAAWNYDLSLNSIGFGVSYGIWWQYPGIGALGGMLAPSLGLTVPFDQTGVDGYADFWHAELTIDLTNTLDYLEELGLDYLEENELAGHLSLYEWLQEETDDVTGEVTKARGIYQGPFSDLAFTLYADPVPYDGSAQEPFPGATQDTWAIVAAMQEQMMDYVAYIPTVTRSSATVFADNVVITWPAYSGAFGWGPNRYRYLNTDADFADGIYNPGAQA